MMLDRLAVHIHTRARAVAIIATIAFLAAGVLGAGVADRLVPYDADAPNTESVVADELLERAGAFSTDIVVLVKGIDIRSPRGSERVAAVSRRIAATGNVAAQASYLDARSTRFVARDGRASYIAVELEATDDTARHAAAERLVDALAAEPGVVVGGPTVAEVEVNEQVANDLKRAELLAFPILFALAFLFFRGVVAALLPLMVGALAIVATFFMLTVASELGSISVFAMNLVTALGLALAIDYSLFIVSRYREEIARDGPGLEAMRRTLGSAGRTVAVSAATVAGATGALMVFPQNFLASMGVGGALVALLAGLISLTVLPAVLVLLGGRIDALAPAALQRRADREARPVEDGFWYRLAHFVMRRPGRVAVATIALLIALGTPALGINFNVADAGVLPSSAGARQVDDALRTDFAPHRETPATLAVSGGADEAERVAAAAAALPGAAQVAPPVRLSGELHAVEVVSSAAPLEDTSRELVRELRNLGDNVQVTGVTARFLDLQSSLVDHIPLLLAIIGAITLVALFLFTGSLIIPLKQLAMNLLGLAAVFGILVLIFQDGRLEGLLGYTSDGAIEATQPLLLFAIGFGLATDYGVFLLSRIKEAREQGHDDDVAIAIGLERTGRIVTAAALLFAVAVGAFVVSEVAFIKQIGLAVALAVLIDATIVRALLVPALMKLLGHRNWWAPGPLRRLHARIGVTEWGGPVPVADGPPMVAMAAAAAGNGAPPRRNDAAPPPRRDDAAPPPRSDAAPGTRLRMTPYQSVAVLRSTPEVLELEGRWGPHGKPPPGQLHPAQVEQFDVLSGALRVRLEDGERVYAAGESFEIPRAAVHGVWNDGDVEARAIWRTLPALNTLHLLEDIDSLYATGRVKPDAMPSVLVWATLLTAYRGVLRLGAGPAPLVRGVFAALAVVGRMRGYGPQRRGSGTAAPAGANGASATPPAVPPRGAQPAGVGGAAAAKAVRAASENGASQPAAPTSGRPEEATRSNGSTTDDRPTARR